MCRVGFGLTSSPFILAATIKFHSRKYEKIYPLAYKVLNEQLYVDDLISGANDLNRALTLSIETRKILTDASMNLRKWKSNSSELNEIWKNEKFTEDEVSTNSIVPLKVLGLIWNTENDELKIDLKPIINSSESISNTKRSILKVSSKVFDPIGFMTPFIIRIKILYQKMWESGLEWDEELNDELKTIWIRWIEELKELQNLIIPRCYYTNIDDPEFAKFQLHIFSDASEAAYGSICYIRYENSNGEAYVSFVASKARVAPIKKVSLPRLELLATVIGARLLSSLRIVFGQNVDYTMWTDSSVALCWIRKKASNWKTFVCNRVTEIQSLTDPQRWKHCSGKDNPADIISRGCTAKNLMENERYWKGPVWLIEPEICWPKTEIFTSGDEANKEKAKLKSPVAVNFIASHNVEENQLLNLENHSSIMKVYRVTAWIRRFVSNCRETKENRIKEELTVEEIENAEEFWIKVIQRENFRDEIESLKTEKFLDKRSKIYELSPFIDSRGLVRVKGRLQKSKFKFEEKHPILIFPKNRFCELLVKQAHERMLHAGVADTLVQLRQQFWIVKGRQYVKTILKKCVVCKRYNSRPCAQIVAPLPANRIHEVPVFSVAGIDFAGPLFVKNSDVKHYIVLFTCAVTRAIHLELVDNLGTETFLLALRRFIGRRGLCSTIISDNAKTFKRAEIELRHIWTIINSSKVKDFYSSHGIKWNYIVERAPWWGGLYERLIRSVKTCLRKIVGKTTLSFHELHTAVIEIEAVINSRPITYTYSDINEPNPLSPSHFLIGERLLTLPAIRLKENAFQSTKKVLVRKFNYRERLLNQFWLRWKKEYILNLKSVHLVSPIKETTIKVNDTVLIEENTPRNIWKMGKVIEVFPGRDGKIRACALKTPHGIIKRAVQLLHNLEISDPEN